MKNILENYEAKIYKGPLLDADYGYYNAATFALPVEEVFNACQNEELFSQVLANLPTDVENFLNLRLKSAERIGDEEYRIIWQNVGQKKFSGTLVFLLKEAPFERGTIVSAEANFDQISLQSEGPSTLMNIFLKRVKAYVECGEIATTKGQPSGREEINQAENTTIH